MAYAVTLVDELAVGAVFDVNKVVAADVVVDVAAREAEHRPYDGHQGAFGGRTDAVETRDTGAAEEVEEEGFDGIVAMMSRSDVAERVLVTEVEEVVIPQMTGGFFNAPVMQSGKFTGIEVGSKEVHAHFLSELTDELLVAVAVAGAEVEIAMRDGERDGGAMEEVGHAHRVATATDGQQHLRAGGQKVLLGQILFKTVEHHLRIIFRICR